MKDYPKVGAKVGLRPASYPADVTPLATVKVMSVSAGRVDGKWIARAQIKFEDGTLQHVDVADLVY
jgi:hypothetical protein